MKKGTRGSYAIASSCNPRGSLSDTFYRTIYTLKIPMKHTDSLVVHSYYLLVRANSTEKNDLNFIETTRRVRGVVVLPIIIWQHSFFLCCLVNNDTTSSQEEERTRTTTQQQWRSCRLWPNSWRRRRRLHEAPTLQTTDGRNGKPQNAPDHANIINLEPGLITLFASKTH